MEPRATALEEFEQICEELFDRWDADMKPGKLLSALSGRLPNYDSRVTRIRDALKKAA